MHRHDEQRAAHGEEAADRLGPAPSNLAIRPLGNLWGLREAFRMLGRVASEQPEVARVHRDQDSRVQRGERSLEDDQYEVEQRRQESEHLDRVLRLKPCC